MPHPNVVLFDVRVGYLTFVLSQLFRGMNRALWTSQRRRARKVKIPTLPKSGKDGAPSNL